jgi:XTP/dITP diphosphohydrolase
VESVEGVAEGLISTTVQGEQGFGYDPVFYYPPMGKRFSEMSLDEKNQVSHRGKALQAARDLIIKRLNRAR